MNSLNGLLQELGVSKVKLAKYLGVSRQMVYNYLVLDSLDKWPKEKKILLLQLLGIKGGNKNAIDNIEVTTEYMMEVEKRLNNSVKSSNDLENVFDLNGLSKDAKTLLNDIAFLIKEKLDEDEDGSAHSAMKYLYYMLQSIDNVPEIKYIFGYMAKTNGFIKPDEYAFDEDKQFVFEGILFSALNLYNNGGASKSRIVETHKRFVQEIEAKNEEKLSRTQQLNTVKIQALRELGYNEINPNNATEVFEKIAEIQSRKV